MSRSVYGRRSGVDPSGGGAFRRSHQPLWGRILYRVLWSMVLALCKVLFRLRVEGKENFPPGPFILSPVHRSFIDTPIAGMATSRRLRFMGKESLWENKPLGAFLSVMGGFPVERGTADRTALRAATDVLSLGEPLVMFPEGTRRSGDRVRREDMLDGPAFVAARAGVPIVPMGLGGTVRALPVGSVVPRPRRVVIVVGNPIPPPSVIDGRLPRRAVSEHTDRLFDELGDLYVEARVLAGQEPV
ncbi:MAG: 1-acyl-sn-glycerol-3-phosphate acyltransferase [Acidimicrobiaceae bacterium]|nr:1-acyl-sn-glycerol-3-phosphate acyltransferase [Acidimicrobiaceae bacterium]